MRFDLKPVALDPNIAKLVLDIDGQVSSAAPNALTPASFQLPSGKGRGQVKLEVTPASARSSLQTECPWAWFRMLDKATVEPMPQGERFKVSFDVSLDRAFTLECFDGLSEPALAPAAPGIAEGAWRLPLEGDMTAAVAGAALQGHSLWWTDGGPGVEASMLVCRNMPQAQCFAAMLDGSWAALGWY